MAGIGLFSVAAEARCGSTRGLLVRFGTPSRPAVWGLPRDSSARELFDGVVLPSGLACWLGASPVLLSLAPPGNVRRPLPSPPLAATVLRTTSLYRARLGVDGGKPVLTLSESCCTPELPCARSRSDPGPSLSSTVSLAWLSLAASSVLSSLSLSVDTLYRAERLAPGSITIRTLTKGYSYVVS